MWKNGFKYLQFFVHLSEKPPKTRMSVTETPNPFSEKINVFIRAGFLTHSVVENEPVREQRAERRVTDTSQPPLTPPCPSLNTALYFDGDPVSGTSLGRQRVTSIQSDIPPIDLSPPSEMSVCFALVLPSPTFRNKIKSTFY